ncbi:MAG: toll/interleukin-1 receptor domain-containing protein [Clostridia bacterium]|nr:toll/interleukin-1 receptor domain-containing protein [Clostridia bacterium]
MRTQAYRCDKCGYRFDYPLERTTFPCIGCGRIHGRPKVEGETLELLELANARRVKCDFVNAAADYREILHRNPEEHTALWGLVLCKYGVEVVKGKLTIHFYREEDVLEDPDYQRARELADEDTRKHYEAQGQYLHEIQEEVRKIRTEPWDIFLCYKQSGKEKGTYAAEYTYAQKLYTLLLQKNYRVFFADVTLNDKLGASYEAQIFHAIYSARVMLVVCGDPENLTTPWVHSEWSRFAQRRDALLIPVLYDQCLENPYAMPGELSGKQSARVRKGDDWFSPLLKVLEREIRETKADQPKVNPDVQERLKGVLYRLDDANWDAARNLADGLIDVYPSCAAAHLYKLLAMKHLRTPDELRGCMEPFESTREWKRAMENASEVERAGWQGILDASLEARRQEEERKRREAEERRRQEEERRRQEAERRRREEERKRREAEEQRRREAERLERERQEREMREQKLQSMKRETEAALREMNWVEAKSRADEMIREFSREFQGHLLRLLAEFELRSLEELMQLEVPFENSKHWQNAYWYANLSRQEEMDRWLKASQELRRKKAEERAAEAERIRQKQAAEAARRAQLEKERVLQRQRDDINALLARRKWKDALQACNELESHPERELLKHMAEAHISDLAKVPADWFGEDWWKKMLTEVSAQRCHELQILQQEVIARWKTNAKRDMWLCPLLTAAALYGIVFAYSDPVSSLKYPVFIGTVAFLCSQLFPQGSLRSKLYSEGVTLLALAAVLFGRSLIEDDRLYALVSLAMIGSLVCIFFFRNMYAIAPHIWHVVFNCQVGIVQVITTDPTKTNAKMQAEYAAYPIVAYVLPIVVILINIYISYRKLCKVNKA